MLTTKNHVIKDCDKTSDAALAAVDFHRKHGAGLCDLIDFLADEVAFDALCDMHGQSGGGLLDTQLILRALATIHARLASQNTEAVDALSIRMGF